MIVYITRCCLALALVTLGNLHAQGEGSDGLDRFLNERGYLDIPKNFTGSIDPAGFKMISAAGEAPRFIAEGESNPSSGSTFGFGGMPSGCNGFVSAVAQADSGLIYLGGRFTVCGDAAVNHIAQYNPETGEFQALGDFLEDGVNNWVFALAIAGDDVYVGGIFTKAGGQPANRIARWDGGTWHALGAGDTNGVSGTVMALAVSGDDVYAGGRFLLAGGQPAKRVARWDGGAWHALGSGDENGVSESGGFDPWFDSVAVQALAISGNDVYVGGLFVKAGSQPANRIARWDGSAWHALGSGDENGISAYGVFWSDFASVRSLAVTGGDVYVGGNFLQAGGQIANHVARWDGSTWHSLGSGVNGNPSSTHVATLAVSDENIYAGGTFMEAGEQPARNIARWNDSNWHILGDEEENGINGSITALAIFADDVYAGGFFDMVDGSLASNFARWDGSVWHTPGSGSGNGLSRQVYALAISGDNVYVGGTFTIAGGKPVNRVARWDGSAWHALGSGEENGVNWTVYALAISGSDVYVGGWFTMAGSQPADRIARWDGNAWHALGTGSVNGVGGQGTRIKALAISGDDLYVGGDFTEAGGQVANRIARWDGSTWHTLGDGPTNGLFGNMVETLAVSGNDIYVGGSFWEAGGQQIRDVARWDGNAWHALGSGDEKGVDDKVLALAISGDDVYVAGRFTQAGGQAANHVTRWDGNAWHVLGSANTNGVDFEVSAMALLGDDIYVGGAYTETDGRSFHRVARWDGNTWHGIGVQPIAGAADDSIGSFNALAADGNGVFVGGEFGTVCGRVSSHIAFINESDCSDSIFWDRFEWE